MARVYCDIVEEEIENDEGRPVYGVIASCRKCGNETEAFGTEEGSIRWCLLQMRNECPRNENNFYKAEMSYNYYGDPPPDNLNDE